MTIPELNIVLIGRHNNLISLAWHTANFSGAVQVKDGLKPLDRYLARYPGRKPPVNPVVAGAMAQAEALGHFKPK